MNDELDKQIALLEFRMAQFKVRDIKFFIDDIMKQKIKHEEAVKEQFKKDVVHMLNQYFDGKCKPI